MPINNIPKTAETSIGSLDSYWQHKAFEELNESPETLNKELSSLRLLLTNDPNLNIPQEDAFLIRFLRAKKYDSKKAFNMMQRYYLMQLKCPELFKCPLPSECQHVFDLQAQLILKERDREGRRIFIIRMDCFDSSKIKIEDIFRTNVLVLEQAVREAETQISGIIVILDMAGLSLQHAKLFTPYYAKKIVELVQETFPLRFKGFHIVNEPFYFDAIMVVLKPFLKEKIRKRIFLHGRDLNALHAFIPIDVLPKEYGGNGGCFDNKSWFMDMLAEEKYFSDLQNYGYKTSTMASDKA